MLNLLYESVDAYLPFIKQANKNITFYIFHCAYNILVAKYIAREANERQSPKLTRT
jgi:hypothetical protein